VGGRVHGSHRGQHAAAGPAEYRILLRTTEVRDGFAVFRLRSRGTAIEVTIADLIVPERDAGAERALLRRLRTEAGGDYLLRVQRPPLRRGLVRVPVGPTLTWRGLADVTPRPLFAWDLRLGDVELF
jgi:hypothetical protein